MVYDRDVASRRLEAIFADDLAYARRIRYRQWRGRGLVDRLLELLSIPVRAQL